MSNLDLNKHFKNKHLRDYIKSQLKYDFSIISDNDAFLIVDLEGKIMYENKKCQILSGFNSVELLDLHLHDIAAPDVNDYFQKLDLGKIHNFDGQIMGKTSSYIDISMTTIPIFFQNLLIGSYIVLQEQTSIMTKKPIPSDQYAAGKAQEIRNPITLIKGFIQLIMHKYSGDRAYFAIIISEIERIERILKELRVLTKSNDK